jgi:hypothetical protein
MGARQGLSRPETTDTETGLKAADSGLPMAASNVASAFDLPPRRRRDKRNEAAHGRRRPPQSLKLAPVGAAIMSAIFPSHSSKPAAVSALTALAAVDSLQLAASASAFKVG